MGNRRRPTIGALTELILATIIGVVAPLTTVCRPLLSSVCGTDIKREAPLLGFQNLGAPRIPGAHGG
jgi:hypothetical protein